ncbi:hypothetical protein OMW55_00395 [Sphingomonas sp. BN140010]|uniref:Secreted protein n=1 Tax=Sphingomonas arvum TaxID=2992113 RepID=A0ABT3JB29_9SPHN|nr:hypothetical protein [Sphingomonas sp. BN140010]MCW3796269.1 hypothetical protein [Sphingomonas sp. BN140010]
MTTMTIFLRTLIPVAGLAAAAVFGASGAEAQQGSGQNGCISPPGLNYMICNGQRVPKGGNRVTNPDGSWREEQRQGPCIVVKEKTAQGEYKETRQCN